MLPKQLISGLPATEIASLLNRSLQERGIAIVTAPPGAGKSTVLPLTMLEGLKPEGRILMLEPRRIAARQVAQRLSDLLGESVGTTVGYRMRGESRVSSKTSIEVLTEGILTRMMISDPILENVSVIIFDEFHERSIHCDEALALALETRRLVRPDLKLVIMSATMDVTSLGRILDAPVIEGKGKMYPIETQYSDDESDCRNCALLTARTIAGALREQEGDVLAFLPGEADVRRCVSLLGEIGNVKVCPLYGMMPFEEQRKALSPSKQRKIVVATPVAETSLTIEGVRIVVDSGLCRVPVFDRRSGLSRLETVRISMDMADQRRGRAGRLGPGVCYRLWTKATETRMEACRKPEIVNADLTGPVLDVAAWGEADASRLPWITPPQEDRLRQARSVLLTLGAIDTDGSINDHGRELSAFACHPRLANMLFNAGTPERKALARDIASLIEERDPAPDAGVDISLHLDAPGAVRRHQGIADPYAVGALVAMAWPERIARAREEGYGHFQMANGEYVRMNEGEAMSGETWIAVASVNAVPGREGTIFLAAPLDESDIQPYIRERSRVAWDSRSGSVIARKERTIGSILVDARQTGDVSRELLVRAICEAAVKEGLTMLDFNEEVQNLQRRVAAAANWRPELELPDLSVEKLLATAPEWLPNHVGKAMAIAELRRIDLCPILLSMLDYNQQKELDRIAPSHITVPSGSRIKVEYRQGADLPIVRVRIQECFGMRSTPMVDGGRRPLLMELLSPGFKPVQLTSDLESFWSGMYFSIRGELRRRYPRHSWPDDPLQAPAVRGVPKRDK